MRKYGWLVFIMGVLMFSGCDSHEVVLIADKRVLAIPVIDNNEPMIDLTKQRELAYGPSPEIPNNTDYTKIRKTVYEKIIEAQKNLPPGLKFRIYEAYRSMSLQKMLFDTRYNKLKAAHPDWSSEKLFTQTTVLVSPVINLDGSQNVPPHSTGGAFDIYLIDAQGQAVDMGIHPADWMEDQDGGVSATDSKLIPDRAQYYRRIMSRALAGVGFVNYPTEYWHWSYGDRYWAYMTKQQYAIYGAL